MKPRFLAFAQLLRVPNVFTALADIGLCAVVAGQFGTDVALVAVASACCYCAGMVWNDVWDVEQDRRERPGRPLPSGRVTLESARRLGLALFGVALACAAIAGPGPLGVAMALVVAVVLYDGWLKRTLFGPLGMGACRFLNILLGFTVVDPDVVPWPLRLHIAAVIGLYIVGVTWFARTEARPSNQAQLRRAAIVMAAALALALTLPLHGDVGAGSPLFVYLLVAFAAFLSRPVVAALWSPRPEFVQAGVKRAVLGLIALDAVLACGVVGSGGLVIVLLLPPAVWLGQWVYST